MQRFTIIDTHTGGEPTRVVFADDMPWGQGGFPERASDVTSRDVIGQRQWLRESGDWIRRAIVREPRGSEFMVGAWVASPTASSSAASVVFFNNIGYLGMCGHGLIGVVEAMRYRGMIETGRHRFETPAGVVIATLHEDESVTFQNVPSYRYRADVSVCVDGIQGHRSEPAAQTVTGDIAYGGNWFFLLDVDEIDPQKIPEMTAECESIRRALKRDGITGRDGAEIDHIELSACLNAADAAGVDLAGRSFVLCPGGHYDRSPCGTGTSAKVACLAADGRLRTGQRWLQESVIGSQFTAQYEMADDGCVVSVRGRAYVTAETTCVLDPSDPYAHGIDCTHQSNRMLNPRSGTIRSTAIKEST